MRFDILTIFPEFFASLNLSLVGKAQARGLIEVGVHNLRNWASGVHQSVDDAPFGGGAGMVMKADIWAAAIDELSTKETMGAAQSDNIVLAIPSPAGKPLKQADLHYLAQKSQLILACGRYEGIDARVAQHYAHTPGYEVFEFSLGDYVLNGGEVAAIALVEGISRLLPGMVGNPASLVEESHSSGGLLEYPNYTRPLNFRGITVPEVLTSGNHGAIARWRKNAALKRTAALRPDLIQGLAAPALDKKDRGQLAELGWFVPKDAAHPVKVRYRQADLADAQALSEFAQLTWPDACPAGTSAQAIQDFLQQNLTAQVFQKYLSDPQQYLIYLAEIVPTESAFRESAVRNEIVAYLLVEVSKVADGVVGVAEGAPVDFVCEKIHRDGPFVYLSKAYVARVWRGSGIFANFAQWGLEQVAQQLAQFPAPFIWLGTAAANKRAQRAYQRIGFQYAGTREFYVGDQCNKDVTMARPLSMAQ